MGQRLAAGGRGAITIVVAVALPALLVVCGVAIEYGMMSRQKAVLQPIAGILVFDTRAATVGRKHVINSNHAHTLVGRFCLTDYDLTEVPVPRGMLASRMVLRN